MATREELLGVLRRRYAEARRAERRRILDEFVAVSGYHRKHAIRLLRSLPRPADRRGRSPVYDEAVRAALVVLWEASDRICGKRLKALLPVLVPAMERHGHLQLDVLVRGRLLTMSAATMDRLLRQVRERGGAGRRRSGAVSVIRRSIRVRTFSDWNDPSPGFMEADLVAHSGPSMAGTFAWTLVLTDIASGWTECVGLPCRDGELIVEALAHVRSMLPFPLLGIDVDNDSVFLNETMVGWCRSSGIELTRSRAYRKNDQAWVEQKNGAVVRRLVGHDRLEGSAAAKELATLYASARLFVNFFQPSFKLASKQRDGARFSRRYHAPATPHARLVATGQLEPAGTEQLEAAFAMLDPIALLAALRASQERIALLAAHGGNADPPVAGGNRTLADFLSGLGVAWQAGEVRATHRARPKVRRYWRSRVDPLAAVAALLRSWLDKEPTLQATDLLARLQVEFPDRYPAKLLRTMQRRVRAWRREIAHELVFGPAAPDSVIASNVMINGKPTARGQPVDLMDDADASPTAPQALPPQLRTTIASGNRRI
jgi:hypothetical protein